MIKITVTGGDLLSQLEKNKKQIQKFIVAQVQENRAELFDKSGKMPGHTPWAPLWDLSPRAGGKPLLDRGTLRKSLGPGGNGGYVQINGDLITIGTRLKYAKLMNWGTTQMPDGKLKAKRAQALMIPVGKNVEAPLKLTKKTHEKKLLQLQEALKSSHKGNRRRVAQQIQKLKFQIRNRTYKTGKFIFRKSVRIPARRFDIWNEYDQAELIEALKNEIESVLNGKNR